MPAPQIILDLVQRFHDSREQYRSGRYNEAQLRREFLDPFFSALGWDMTNAQNNAPQYREVIQEDTVEIEGQAKAPDYAFGIFGVRKFFVEAKKPAVNIRYDIHPAFQLRRYAWSAHLPLSILTDFEEFAVYDTRVKPDHKDSASVARTMVFTYADYAERWDEIASIFSKDAILKGSFDRYVQDTKAKKGTTEVDDDFLKSIEGWRELLARNIALRNPSARSESTLNYAVQMTIDRLIFLRICEDRGIEPEFQLRDLTTTAGIYPRLVNLYIKADQKYNSGLFHFSAEKGQTTGEDTFTPNLVIDDKALKEIITSLYYPESAYAFNVIPVEILGQVYEQFLGKVIRLTAGGAAKVEEKPEVRKAGGVYYTPRYIVDYIVENTVGKLLEGKTPKEAADLRIVDPACGSGSFLLGAYQYLLDWHHKYYLDPANGGADSFTRGRNPVLAQRSADEYHLTTAEKKRILVNNIYGVDLDHQAVEVTKLSLLLKLLEEEHGQLSLGFVRVLPDLGHNIRCGNSLIGWDYFQGQLMADDEEVKRVNPFNWQEAFPEVFAKGGFDAVIGNPPYIFTRDSKIGEEEKSYYYKHYIYQSSQLNTFGLFIEQSHILLNQQGMLGFITPNNWLTISSFSNLRRFILHNTRDLVIVNNKETVFSQASVDTAVTLFAKGNPTTLIVGELDSKEWNYAEPIDVNTVTPPSYIIQINLIMDREAVGIVNKINAISKPLSEFVSVSSGIKAYQIGKGKPIQTKHQKENRMFHSDIKIDEKYIRYLEGVDVKRYLLEWSGQYISYGKWLAEPRESVPFVGPRLLVRQIPSKPPYQINAVFTDENFINDINSMVIFEPSYGVSLHFILGLLNSKLMSFWFSKTFDKFQRKIFPQFKVNELKTFPVVMNTNDDEWIKNFVKIVSHVQTMLLLQRKNRETPNDASLIRNQIAITEKEIDRLVYILFELSEEEVNVVELSSFAPKN